jgi:hypothetical protein
LKQSTAQSAVAIIPDSGANYLDQIYSNDWLAEKGIQLLNRGEVDERLKIRRVVDIDRTGSEAPEIRLPRHAAVAS